MRISLAHARRVLHRDLGDRLGRRLARSARRRLRRAGSRIGHGACRALTLEGGKGRRLRGLHCRLGHGGSRLLDGIHHSRRGARRSPLHGRHRSLNAIVGRLRTRLHPMGNGFGSMPRGYGCLSGHLTRLLGSLASGVLHSWCHTLGGVLHSGRNTLGGVLHSRHGGTRRALSFQARLASKGHDLACQIHIVTPLLRSRALIPPAS